jgi:hypothetical protein
VELKQLLITQMACLPPSLPPLVPPQIHVLDGGKKVHIYSRNAEDMTPRYPDIISRLPAWLAEGTSSIVLDGEAVAWDIDKAKILPFQVCVECWEELSCDEFGGTLIVGRLRERRTLGRLGAGQSRCMVCRVAGLGG